VKLPRPPVASEYPCAVPGHGRVLDELLVEGIRVVDVVQGAGIARKVAKLVPLAVMKG